jgi:hypothetical protein
MTQDRKPDGLCYPTIISSYKLFEYCKNRYKKRFVYPAIEVKHDDFYYYSRVGKLRMVRNKKEIWINGEEFPVIVRIR